MRRAATPETARRPARSLRRMWDLVRDLLRPVPLPPDPVTPAYGDGWDAFEAGVPRGACPYVGKQQIRDWQAGWDRAAHEVGGAW